MKEVAGWARGDQFSKAAPVDLTLEGDMVSGSPFQVQAKKASEIMFRKTNPNGAPPTEEELAYLQAFQAQQAAKWAKPSAPSQGSPWTQMK